MSSKSVLLLGIVFVFLLNVVAVHNYINSYYYQPDKVVIDKNNFFNIDILKNLSSDVSNVKKEVIEPEHEIIKKSKVKSESKEINNKEEIISYKSHYANQIENEKKSWDTLFKNKKSDNNISKEKKKEKNDRIVQADESEKSAYIVLNLNINNQYTSNNPIIKKIIKNLDNKKIIKIKIYKYSIKIKEYLEKIKKDFAEQGVDMDDIKVIYNKDESKKNKIKILLTKKD